MSNLPISTSKGSISFSLKEKAAEIKEKADAIIMATQNLAIVKTPQSMELVKTALEGIIESAKNLIDKKCEEELGYTLETIRYKTLEGKRLLDEYKELSKDKDKQTADKRDRSDELKTKKNKALNRLLDWLKNQSDAIYNGFIMVQIKDTIEETTQIVNELWNSGTSMIKDNLTSLNSLKQVFVKGSGVFKKEVVNEDIKSTVAYLNGMQDSVESLLSEMQKSATNTAGEAFKEATDLSEKGMTGTVKTLLTIIVSLISTLGPLYTLIENYNTNKQTLRDDATALEKDIQNKSADDKGVTKTAQNNASSAILDTSNYVTRNPERIYEDTQQESTYKKITPDASSDDDEILDDSIGKNPNYDNLTNIELKASTDTSLNDNTQKYIKDFMDFVTQPDDKPVEKYYTPMLSHINEAPIEYNDENYPVPNGNEGVPQGDVMKVASSDFVYYCGEDENYMFSEIHRVPKELDLKQEYCKLDETKPLYSISTKTDGGKMVNLEYSGNNRKEMREAILQINGGVRL